ncbi:MAG: protein phosphatase 2C domain-containing protein [Bacteroidia bacterium]|nr:protein phosphatase 2C domain-containing protein [Bacteroidia bacterium]MCF8447063.1 protein phosphatase 2C domain-containing protein [Bacteroidia bacterium]
MQHNSKYIKNLFNNKGVEISSKRVDLFERFVSDNSTIGIIEKIRSLQTNIMENWQHKNRVQDIIEKQIIIPNATVNKEYKAFLDFEKLGLNDISYSAIEGLEELGLVYDNEKEIVVGVPKVSGDFKVNFKFRIKDDLDDSLLHEKKITLVINADPKSLWKNIQSDFEKTEDWKIENYWKKDDEISFEKLGEKNIVISSKRGRSHANVGSFRDDDFAYKFFDHTGWSVVCVADGAGSAKLARKGSTIACNAIIEFFTLNFTKEALEVFDNVIKEHQTNKTAETSKQISHFVYDNLSKAALFAHKKIEEFATQINVSIKDLHTTLIFTLIKKYDFGYAILSFGVGDCPIGVINKDFTEIKLMNWLDVGEFGGGTRFITMPEIFNSEKFPTRFGISLYDDFSYLVLMTDGIYDPKFIVEANLEKIECWKDFFEDLQGKNNENVNVNFEKRNIEVAENLSKWMDFWSPGNHDDRTLAIIY